MIQLRGLLSRLLEPLLKTGLPLIENVLKSFAESALVPLELTAKALAADAAIQKKVFESSTTTLVFSKKTRMIS